MNGGRLLCAALIGTAAGAVLALLYAPAQGRETRAYLIRRTRDQRERAERGLARGRETLRRQRARVKTAWEAGRARLKRAGRHAARAVEQGRAAAELVTDEGRQAYGELRAAQGESLTALKP